MPNSFFNIFDLQWPGPHSATLVWALKVLRVSLCPLKCEHCSQSITLEFVQNPPITFFFSSWQHYSSPLLPDAVLTFSVRCRKTPMLFSHPDTITATPFSLPQPQKFTSKTHGHAFCVTFACSLSPTTSNATSSSPTKSFITWPPPPRPNQPFQSKTHRPSTSAGCWSFS